MEDNELLHAGKKNENNHKQRKLIKNIVNKFPGEPFYLLPILNKIQEELGYISPDATELISKHVGVSQGRVYSVITFADFFCIAPKGRYVIEVCGGAACKVKGGRDILAVLEAELGIKEGETTKNGFFSIVKRNCLDACALAPAMRVNGHIYGKLEPKDVLRIVKEHEIGL